jgi:lauroyl/myristoyl acyltransferase
VRPSNRRNFVLTVAAWSLEIASWLVRPLPRSLRYGIARTAGFFYGRLAVAKRRALRLNLSILLGQTPLQLDPLVDESFANFGAMLLDLFIPSEVRIDVPDRPRLEAWRKKYHGLLVLTFHMGHWELGARTMSEWGWPVTAVYQPYTNKRFKRVMEKRRAPGVRFVSVGRKAARGVGEALRRGEIVAMLGDMPFGETGTPVNVMGHRIIWPKGPVVLAVRDKAPIVVAVVVRSGPGIYRAHLEEPILPGEGGRREVERIVQEVADKFGKLLRGYPSQWYRFKPLEFVDKAGKSPASPTATPGGLRS